MQQKHWDYNKICKNENFHCGLPEFFHFLGCYQPMLHNITETKEYNKISNGWQLCHTVQTDQQMCTSWFCNVSFPFKSTLHRLMRCKFSMVRSFKETLADTGVWLERMSFSIFKMPIPGKWNISHLQKQPQNCHETTQIYRCPKPAGSICVVRLQCCSWFCKSFSSGDVSLPWTDCIHSAWFLVKWPSRCSKWSAGNPRPTWGVTWHWSWSVMCCQYDSTNQCRCLYNQSFSGCLT